MEKHGPCLDKNCAHCCDPVKVDTRVNIDLPKDEDGNDLWVPRNELLAPETKIDTDKVLTYDCKNFDPETKKCLDYENRPEICRDTTCITDSKGNIDEQHRKVTEVKFIKLK